MLLKGQSLTVERPPRAVGTAIGAAASLLALVLASALLVRGLGWPISFPQFLAYTGAGILFVLAAVFAFWAVSCAMMRYMMDRTGLTIRWGPIRHHIAIDHIRDLVRGAAGQRPRVSGISWWGYHIGRGEVEELGNVLFFTTHRSPEEIVYIRTPEATYAVSPSDPVRFIAEANRLRESGQPDGKPPVQRNLLAGHPIWADHIAQGLAASAVVLNLVLWGFLFAVYPGLSSQITIEFPPIGDIQTLRPKSEILRIPATATAILAINLIAGLAFQSKERAAAYLLLSGAVALQLVLWVGAAIAVANA